MFTAENNKTESRKLLAAFAVLALVVCAFAAVVPAVDAADGDTYVDVITPGEDAVPVTDFAGLQKALSDAAASEEAVEIVILPTKTVEEQTVNASFAITQNITIPENVKLFIGESYGTNGTPSKDDSTKLEADENTFTMTVNEGVTVTVQGDVYNNLGKNKYTASVIVNGTVAFDGGLLYSVGALSFGENGKVLDAFFTNSNGNSKTTAGAIQYKHMYSSDIDAIAPYVNSVDYSDTTESEPISAIYSYGDVSIGKITSAINKITIVVGGVTETKTATVTFTEDATVTPAALNVKTGSEAVNNGNVTLKSANIAGTYTNNNKTTVDGTVTGTIDSAEDATVTLTNNVSVVTGLSLNGGVLDNKSSTKPVLESGVQYVGADGKKYIATSIATSDLYTIIIGINAVDYKPGMNYAGTNSSISIDRYAIFDKDGAEVAAEKYTYRFLSPNAIYYDENDAKLDNKNYGTVTEVGTYYMSMSIAYGAVGADDSGTTVVTGDFKILPVEATVVITGTELIDPENPETGYKIPNQTYYESEDGVTLTEGVDFTFKVTVDGVEVPADSYTYEITYQDNTKAGNAKVIVTVSGNYSGSDDEAFIIDSKVLSLTVTPVDAEKDYHVGESVSTTDFTIVGNNDDGTTNSTLDASKITISPETFTEAGEIVVTFIYENADGTEATGEATVTVHGVAAIEITAEPTDAEKGYMAGATISTAGMSVTVTYDDEATAVFTDNDGKGLIKTGSSAVDPYFIFDSLTLNYGIGDEVPVKVTYFGVSDEFYVKVTGYLINYVYYQGEKEVFYATQAGSEGAAIVYNFAIASPVNGESFNRWLVEGTSSMYLPGTQIEYGADKNLWGEGNIITLIAQFGGTGTVTPEPVDPATEVKVYIGFTETGVELMFYGVDGYVPANITFTMTYTYTVVIGDVTYTTPGFIESTTVTNENNSTVVIVPIEPEMLEGGILYGAYATVTIGDLTFNTPMITHVA